MSMLIIRAVFQHGVKKSVIPIAKQAICVAASYINCHKAETNVVMKHCKLSKGELQSPPWPTFREFYVVRRVTHCEKQCRKERRFVKESS